MPYVHPRLDSVLELCRAFPIASHAHIDVDIYPAWALKGGLCDKYKHLCASSYMASLGSCIRLVGDIELVAKCICKPIRKIFTQVLQSCMFSVTLT